MHDIPRRTRKPDLSLGAMASGTVGGLDVIDHVWSFRWPDGMIVGVTEPYAAPERLAGQMDRWRARAAEHGDFDFRLPGTMYSQHYPWGCEIAFVGVREAVERLNLDYLTGEKAERLEALRDV